MTAVVCMLATTRITTRSPKSCTSFQTSPFTQLLEELQFFIFGSIKSPTDRANLCLAYPPFGLRVQRVQTKTTVGKDPLLAIAMKLLDFEAKTFVDELLLRKYSVDSAFTDYGCEWLAAQCAAQSWHLHIRRITSPADDDLSTKNFVTEWYMYNNDTRGALLRMQLGATPPEVYHFVGDNIAIFTGPRGQERLTTARCSCGVTFRYLGEKDKECIISKHHPNGSVIYYKGERGKERPFIFVATNGIRMYI